MRSEEEKPSNIHNQKKRQYEKTCGSLQLGYEWHMKFMGVDMADAARSFRPHTANRSDVQAEVERMIWENRRVTKGG